MTELDPRTPEQYAADVAGRTLDRLAQLQRELDYLAMQLRILARYSRRPALRAILVAAGACCAAMADGFVADAVREAGAVARRQIMITTNREGTTP
jgi:hypothetical protein